jgi:hypothetical protein
MRADGPGNTAIHAATWKGKPTIWRWQARCSPTTWPDMPPEVGDPGRDLAVMGVDGEGDAGDLAVPSATNAPGDTIVGIDLGDPPSVSSTEMMAPDLALLDSRDGISPPAATTPQTRRL